MTSAVKNVTLPADLVSQVEALSQDVPAEQQIRQILEEWVQRIRAERVIALAGFVKAEDHPEWTTGEQIDEWVRRLRSESDASDE